MTVLVACEESQTVCKAFRRLGHEAYSCDIKDCTGGHPEWHLKCDAHDAVESRVWDLLIAHPPCTYLTKAGARWMYKVSGGIPDKKRTRRMELASDFFDELFSTPFASHVAVENPTPLKMANLPKESQVIQPWMFGHPFSKRTCLWLRDLPRLVPTRVVKPIGPWCPTGQHKNGIRSAGFCKRGDDAANRSKTFEGIASAMAEQWSKYIEKEK